MTTTPTRRGNWCRTRRTNLVGQTFNRWTVIAPDQMPDGAPGWRCQCSCGTVRAVIGWTLTKGASKSCGCWNAEQVRKKGKNRKHGMHGTPTYKAWLGMRERCTNNTRRDWLDYGGRGITYCSQWDTFEGFFADMGIAPAGLTLDREDVNGNYEPGNCRWATADQQANNTRVNRHITAFGETKTMARWCRDPRCAVRRDLLAWRLNRGQSPEMAISTPPGRTSTNWSKHRATVSA